MSAFPPGRIDINVTGVSIDELDYGPQQSNLLMSIAEHLAFRAAIFEDKYNVTYNPDPTINALDQTGAQRRTRTCTLHAHVGLVR